MIAVTDTALVGANVEVHQELVVRPNETQTIVVTAEVLQGAFVLQAVEEVNGNERLLASTNLLPGGSGEDGASVAQNFSLTITPQTSTVSLRLSAPQNLGNVGTGVIPLGAPPIITTPPISTILWLKQTVKVNYLAQEQFTVTLCDSIEDKYRFGFNGMEKDNELKGIGNSLDFGARMYDSRIGRWLSKDPLAAKYPYASPFNFALNTPIQAKDPDGKVVLFINGQHTTDGGKTDYWRKDNIKYARQQSFDKHGNIFSYNVRYVSSIISVDKAFMNAFGDHAARYYDGSSGGWYNSLFATKDVNLSYENRIKAGEQMGYSQAADIYKNLEKGETVKIVTHSMGTAYSRGFVDGMETWAKENKVAFKFEIQVDLAAFDGEDLPAHHSVDLSFYKSGDQDWLANDLTILGNYKSSDIPGTEKIPTQKGTPHSVYDYDASGVPESNSNNSAKPNSPPVYEQSR